MTEELGLVGPSALWPGEVSENNMHLQPWLGEEHNIVVYESHITDYWSSRI